MAGASKLTCFYILFEFLLGFSNAYYKENPLKIGETIYSPRKPDKNLEIYCYSPQPKHMIHLWRTVSVSISIPPDQYEFYAGSTFADVLEQYESEQSYWKFNLFSSKNQKITLHPFNGSCLGIYTNAAYHAQLNIIWVDFWKVLMLVGGITLFILAPKLSHNTFFYYLCGMALGVCASFLFILFIFSKLLPRKPAMVMFLVGGWTVSVYLLQLIWNNLQLIMVEYPSFVIGYTSLASFISFIICYRFGPVTDPRSKNLIKWTLQEHLFVWSHMLANGVLTISAAYVLDRPVLSKEDRFRNREKLIGKGYSELFKHRKYTAETVSIGLIFFSSDFQDATIAIIIIILVMYNFPASWGRAIKTFWRKKFPPRMKLLTESEFIDEGVVETKKALTELKKHCSSPECNAWKTVLHLKDPLRFASFIEGNSHISDDEIINYERDSEGATELLTEDSDSESE